VVEGARTAERMRAQSEAPRIGIESGLGVFIGFESEAPMLQ
jgi:hypothetical protein